MFINNDESKLTKSSSQTLFVSGYDKKTVLQKYRLTYNYPQLGLIQGTPYYTELCEYTKYVEIPKGYSIVIPASNPPITIMSVKSYYISNMGYVPNSSPNIGYAMKYISTSGDKDKYALITHVEELTKNLLNNKVLQPTYYNPKGVDDPSNFSFAYQILNVSWN